MRATLRPFRRIQDDEAVVDVDAAALNEARLAEARRVPSWHEVDEPVTRGRHLVDSETDTLYGLYRGPIWVRGRVKPEYNAQLEMYFYAGREGGPVMLERLGGTWSAIVERQARRKASSSS